MTGRELKKIRLQLGLSQAALARLLEKQRETVNRWERGFLKIPRAIEFAMRYLLMAENDKGKDRPS